MSPHLTKLNNKLSLNKIIMQVSMDDALQPKKIIQLCLNCEETITRGRKYCDFCGTVDLRKKMEIENEAIKQENLKLGFNYPD